MSDLMFYHGFPFHFFLTVQQMDIIKEDFVCADVAALMKEFDHQREIISLQQNAPRCRLCTKTGGLSHVKRLYF